MSVQCRKSDFTIFEGVYFPLVIYELSRALDQMCKSQSGFTCLHQEEIWHGVCLWTLLHFTRCCCWLSRPTLIILCMSWTCLQASLRCKGLSPMGFSASHNVFQGNVCICNLEAFHSGVTVFYGTDWNSWSCSLCSIHSLVKSLMLWADKLGCRD